MHKIKEKLKNIIQTTQDSLQIDKQNFSIELKLNESDK